MAFDRIVTAGDVGFTGHGQILDTKPKSYWGRVIEHVSSLGPNCYKVRRIYDGSPDFPDLDVSTNIAYEVNLREDVPVGSIVRLHHARFGAYWTFDYAPGQRSDSGGSGFSSCFDCLRRLCYEKMPYYYDTYLQITNVGYRDASDPNIIITVPKCIEAIDTIRSNRDDCCLSRLCVTKVADYVTGLYYVSYDNRLIRIKEGVKAGLQDYLRKLEPVTSCEDCITKRIFVEMARAYSLFVRRIFYIDDSGPIPFLYDIACNSV